MNSKNTMHNPATTSPLSSTPTAGQQAPPPVIHPPLDHHNWYVTLPMPQSSIPRSHAPLGDAHEPPPLPHAPPPLQEFPPLQHHSITLPQPSSTATFPIATMVSQVNPSNHHSMVEITHILAKQMQNQQQLLSQLLSSLPTTSIGTHTSHIGIPSPAARHSAVSADFLQENGSNTITHNVAGLTPFSALPQILNTCSNPLESVPVDSVAPTRISPLEGHELGQNLMHAGHPEVCTAPVVSSPTSSQAHFIYDSTSAPKTTNCSNVNQVEISPVEGRKDSQTSAILNSLDADLVRILQQQQCDASQASTSLINPNYTALAHDGFTANGSSSMPKYTSNAHTPITQECSVLPKGSLGEANSTAVKQSVSNDVLIDGKTMHAGAHSSKQVLKKMQEESSRTLDNRTKQQQNRKPQPQSKSTYAYPSKPVNLETEIPCPLQNAVDSQRPFIPIAATHPPVSFNDLPHPPHITNATTTHLTHPSSYILASTEENHMVNAPSELLVEPTFDCNAHINAPNAPMPLQLFKNSSHTSGSLKCHSPNSFTNKFAPLSGKFWGDEEDEAPIQSFEHSADENLGLSDLQLCIQLEADSDNSVLNQDTPENFKSIGYLSSLYTDSSPCASRTLLTSSESEYQPSSPTQNSSPSINITPFTPTVPLLTATTNKAKNKHAKKIQAEKEEMLKAGISQSSIDFCFRNEGTKEQFDGVYKSPKNKEILRDRNGFVDISNMLHRSSFPDFITCSTLICRILLCLLFCSYIHLWPFNLEQSHRDLFALLDNNHLDSTRTNASDLAAVQLCSSTLLYAVHSLSIAQVNLSASVQHCVYGNICSGYSSLLIIKFTSQHSIQSAPFAVAALADSADIIAVTFLSLDAFFVYLLY
ncbi:hypothetical protein LguiA_016907 [Lonicera macranthoides]